MRIIAGKYKGRVIYTAKLIRPTEEKVRKSLFDILGDISGVSFLELFAGSGAVGFEALSRGAESLTLSEDNRDAVSAINRNIEALESKSCHLYPKDAWETLKMLRREGRKFDIIFLDPPYHRELAKKALQILGAYDILSPDGFIIAQHFRKESLPEEVADLLVFRQVKYGETVLSFYKKRET